jgi:predicted RNase H-like HicB family nuclease
MVRLGDRMSSKTYNYKIVIHPAESGESGYWVEVPALPGCFSRGATVEECLKSVKEAIALHLETLANRGQPIPQEPEDQGALVSTVRLEVPVRVA